MTTATPTTTTPTTTTPTPTTTRSRSRELRIPLAAGPKTSGEEGAAFVELPLAFVAVCIFALCFTALGQMFIEYHHVSGAARAAARYATKSDYDPATSPLSSSRRPSSNDVTAFAQQAASPLPASEVNVTLTPDTVAGNGVTVEVTHTVDGGAYGLVTDTANRLLDLIGADPLPGLTVHADATAIYE